MKEEPKSTNRDEVYEQARVGMEKKYNMIMLKPMEYNNTYALAMPKKIADQKNINTISDLGNVAQEAKVDLHWNLLIVKMVIKECKNYITISSQMLKRWSRSCVIAQLNLEMLT